MSRALSPTMMAALTAIHDHGGMALSLGGGWWKSKDGWMLYVKPRLGLASEPLCTRTIYALETRGMLRRLNQEKRSWKDAYLVTEAGAERVKQARDSLKDPTDDHD